MVGTHRDVSENHRLEEQLLQSQKMDAIGRLAGGVAHDFNNLLTSILSAAEFAGEAVPEGSPAREDLAVNARAAMPRGGRLVFETRNVHVKPESGEAREVTPGDWVLLSVSDTGSGMSSETMARIFEPFFTTKEAGRGTGLGLATVYGTVKQAGGHISVASELGRGTRFDILLPRAEGVAPSETPRLSEPSRGGGETVLLVEDDALVLEVNTRALAALGYRVLPCRGGAEALERTRSHGARIDLLVSDVVMPRMSGPALARALEALRPGLRTLFVSGYAEELMAAHPRTTAPFLPKPFTPRALAAKVREVLDASALPARDRDTLVS